jgi:hypothetical protein
VSPVENKKAIGRRYGFHSYFFKGHNNKKGLGRKVWFRNISQVFCSPECCLEPVGDIDLPEDIIEMGLDRVTADAKSVGDLFVCGPLGYQGEYLFLSRS